ncbi:MAG: hypothetical protein QF886_25465, partial [Planctomycetota bacterium]|nr:hypothetical protein [Planctomycetota bacterium]
MSARINAEQASKAENNSAWSETVNGLQCRLVPIASSLDRMVVFTVSVQFRNGGEDNLTVDLTGIYDTPFALYSEENTVITFKPNPDVVRAMRLPAASPVLLKPGEVVAFTRPIRNFSDYDNWYPMALFGEKGWRVRSVFGEQGIPSKQGPLEIRFVLESRAGARTGTPDLWAGKIDVPPLKISTKRRLPALGQHEWRQFSRYRETKVTAGLASQLKPLESRVLAGGPCWLRLLLRDTTGYPRQFKSIPNILAPGRLIVTGPDGKRLISLVKESADKAEMHSIISRGAAVVC